MNKTIGKGAMYTEATIQEEIGVPDQPAQVCSILIKGEEKSEVKMKIY